MRKEIDTLKAIAITAVVILHFNAFHFALFPFQTPEWNRTLLIDIITRFCVPLFVALSGYTLTSKYLATKLSLKDFYFRRATKLIPLYVFWSLVIYFAVNLTFPTDPIKMLIYGQADYHLYYVPMIFQLYLVFPLIFFFLKKHANIVVFAALVLQLLTFYYYSLNPQFSDQEQFIHMTTWIFYFCLGMFLAKNENRYKQILIPLLMLVAGLIWSYVDVQQNIAKNIDLIIVTKTFRLPVMLYATGVILLVISQAKKLLYLPKPVITLLAFIGVQSYLIYLCHTLFLRIIFAHIAPQISQGNISYLATSAIGGVFLCSVIWPFFNKKFFAVTRPTKSLS